MEGFKMYFQCSQVGPNTFRIVGPDYDCIQIMTEAEAQAKCVELHNELRNENLKKALAERTDGMFFKFEAGEITKEEWLAARQLVIDEYPEAVVGE